MEKIKELIDMLGPLIKDSPIQVFKQMGLEEAYDAAKEELEVLDNCYIEKPARFK